MEGRDFDALVEKHELRKVAYCRCASMLRNYPDKVQIAEDLAQMTLIKAWRAMDQFREGANLKTWVSAIATNATIDYLRATKKKRQLTLSLNSVVGHNAHGEEVVLEKSVLEKIAVNHTEETYVDKSSNHERLTRLSQALQKLNRQQWSVIMLWLEGMSYLEIASTLGLPEGTVKSRINRAVDQLRDYY